MTDKNSGNVVAFRPKAEEPGIDPCPFCENESPEILWKPGAFDASGVCLEQGWTRVHCEHCGALGPVAISLPGQPETRGRMLAIASWNRWKILSADPQGEGG